ncbi:LysR family transcriptional regulator [Verticiella sediminum]|uniref:LysR family transcriptional regulator n=1 Tax=Verticiella sediminum TaxID=1247510 RepID=A0A556AE94_9BURK|nr:LysR family transcriptional regulator [Verticiella sediminum]TSH91214.1 LysR family transcriptional regulator [Verticiella sediminum]
MDRWTQMELLVQTAELGSMSRAADALGVSNAAASRHLASLEKRIGARLIQRSTRGLTLTEVGQSFYQSCKSALADVRDAEAAASATTLNPTGTLRLTASLSFSVHHIAPLLQEYTNRYPNVKIHIEVANRYYDLIDNNIDVAIRTREFENDSSITVRRLAATRRILAASPGYLAAFGAPRSVEELASRPLLLYTYSNKPHEFTFRRGDDVRSVHVNGPLESNDGQVLRAAALDGMGILVQPKYIVYDDLVAGRLVSVLDDWDLPRLTINIAFQSRRHISAKVRTFVDFLVEHFERMDHDRKWTSFDHASRHAPIAAALRTGRPACAAPALDQKVHLARTP